MPAGFFPIFILFLVMPFTPAYTQSGFQDAGHLSSLISLTDSLLKQSDARGAIHTGTQSLAFAIEKKDRSSALLIHRQLATGYRLITNKVLEKFHLEQALILSKILSNQLETAESYRALGRFFLNLDVDRCDSLVTIALSLYQKEKYAPGIMSCLSNLGQVAYTRKQTAKALSLFSRALQMADSLENIEEKSKTLGRLSYAFWQDGNFRKQLESVAEQYELVKVSASPDVLSDILTDMALAQINLGQLDEAEKNLVQALEIVNKVGALERKELIFNLFAEIRKKQTQWKEASIYLDSARQLFIQINSVNQLNQIRNAEIQEDLFQKEHEFELLRRDSDIQNLIWMLVTTFLVFTGFYFLIVMRNQKRHSKQLEETNSIINLQREELKNAFENLTKSENQFKTLFNLSPVGIILETMDGIIIDTNQAVCRLTGFTREELVGTSVTRFVPENQQHTVLENIKKLVTGDHLQHETLSINRDGSFAHLELNEIKIDLPDGNSYIMVISQDITRRKLTEAALILAKEEAEAASRAKSNFLAMVSHEIRTPLNGILGMANLLLLSKQNDEQLEQIRIILTSGKNLMTIINDILDYSRIEAGKMELEPAPFSIPVVIGEVFSLVGNQGKNIKLTQTVSDEIPEILIGDATRIRQIFFNLVGNAVKFTEAGEVHVEIKVASKNATRMMIEGKVSDTGIGIPNDRLDRLFKPFSQVDDFQTRRFTGTGLGLKIVADLVKLMGGKISVKSKKGFGSEFTFTMELILSDEVNLKIQSLSPSVPIRENLAGEFPLEILVAEDNQVNQKVIRKTLEKLGYKPNFVSNGIEAVKAIELKSFDLILMDIQMPEMDGFEATRLIRIRPIVQPVIIALTAHAQQKDHQDCLDAGMNDFISKPFQIQELQEKLIKWGKKSDRSSEAKIPN
ncbi:MAG: response regulator [Bacteroidetes bacterium]|nr:response regulator [Bacteroidota bacterium]